VTPRCDLNLLRRPRRFVLSFGGAGGMVMRRSLPIVFTVLMVVSAASPGPAADKEREAEAKVRAKLRGYWQELDPRLPKDKQVGPNGGITWEVFPD
jgi:hypothetical protein